MKRAFTLAETVFSVTLIGLLLLFVLNLYPSALYAQRAAQQRQRAGELARSQLELRMDAPFRSLTPGLRKELEPFTENGVNYALRLEIDASNQADPEFLRVIRIVVRWDYKGRTHQIQRELWRHRLPHQR